VASVYRNFTPTCLFFLATSAEDAGTRTAAAVTQGVNAMRKSLGKCAVCLGLSGLMLIAQGCMIGGGHGGGGGSGGGGHNIPGASLTSLSPASVAAGSPPFTLTINGSGFVAGGSLTWNGTTALGPYTFVSSTEVTVRISASLIANPGSGAIVATIPTPLTNPSNALALAISPFTSSACVLFGLYQFFFTGFDSNGPVTIGGAFGVDANGSVSGEEDFKDLAGTRAAQSITGGSCKNSATPNEGTLTVTTAAGTSTYSFATQARPVPGLRGQMAESGDANGVSGSGRFVFTPPGGFFSGSYVLALVGSDSGGGRMGVLGSFTDNNGNCSVCPGTLGSGMGDINDAGTLTPSVPITGNVSVPDSYSRSTVTLNLGAQTLNLALYVISSQLGFAVDVDSGSSSPLLAGFVNVQNSPGTYSNGFLNAPVVFSTWGTIPGTPASSDTSLGIASGFNSGAGTFNIQLDTVAGAVASLNQAINGATYAIASNGRATISYTASAKMHNSVLYLDGMNDGYILDSSGSVGFGFFEAQATGPFTNSSINGTFVGGTWFPPVSTSPNNVGAITLNNGVISGAVNGTYAVDSLGRGTGSVSLPTFGSNDVVFYIVGPNNFYVMGSDAVTNDTIGFLHL
jgi:hypothetical protein